MIRRDMDRVIEIEEKSFQFAWTEEDFTKCLRQRNCIGMVVELEEQVVGYVVYALDKKMLEVMNLAVDPNYRRQSIGRQIITKLIGKLDGTRRNQIVVRTADFNLNSQLFFRAMGFRCIKVERDAYTEQDADAYLFRYRVGRPYQHLIQSSVICE